MRLNRIELLGFRQLVNRSFDFKPGLNLVYGPNEAGKSTLMEAIAIMLYGSFDTGRISSKEREALNQQKPWSYIGDFGGSLKYTLDTGEAFEVRRTFAPETSTVLSRLADQRNITDKFRFESDGRVYFAEEHLGISKPVFENVCVVRQSELALLEQSAAPIAETIMRLSSTMAADGLTVNQSLALLETTFKQKVGTPRAHSKPLAMTRKRVEELQRSINDARLMRERTWQTLTSAKTIDMDISRLERQYLDLQILLLKSRQYSVIETLDHIARLEQELDEAQLKVIELQEWKDFRHDLYEQLLTLDAKRTSLQVEIEVAPQNLSEKLNILQTVRQELATRIVNSKSLSPELIHTISAKKNEIEKAAQAVAVAQGQVEKYKAEADKARSVVEILTNKFRYVEIGHNALAKLRHRYEANQTDLDKLQADLIIHTAEWKRTNIEESAFLALKNAPLAAPQKKGCKPLKRNIQSEQIAPSEIAIYSDLLPIYTKWKNTQESIRNAEQSKVDLEVEIRQVLQLEDDLLDIEIFDHASSQIDAYLKNVAAREVALHNLEEADTMLEQAKSLLISLESELGGLVPEGIQANQDIEEEFQQIEKVRLQLSDVERQIQEVEAENAQWQRKQAEYQQVLQGLGELYSQAQIDDTLNFDERLQGYKFARERYLAWQVKNREAEVAEQRVTEFPFQADKLKTQVADLEQQLQMLLDKNPEADSLQPTQSVEYYQSELENLQHQIHDLKQKQIALTGDSAQASETMIDLASLLEEYAEATAELKKLEWFGEALQTAQSELSKASTTFQQQFTPRLQAFLNGGMSYTTSGRYTESIVDPETLAVELLAPETQQWIQVDQVSTGTRDLVYLLLRFSIARLMSNSGEQLPMLLDDTFVHCDRNRKANILNYLVKQASEMQFILFTQDEWSLSWLKKNHPDCNRIVMSHDENTAINYSLVEALVDQSEAVRERLLSVEESNKEFSGSSDLDDKNLAHSASKEIAEDKSQEISELSQEIIQEVNKILASDKTATKLLQLLEKSNWEAISSDLRDILQGQFLGVVLDNLNSRSLDILGDQIVYTDNERVIVTEEYRLPLRYLLRQMQESALDVQIADSGDFDN